MRLIDADDLIKKIVNAPTQCLDNYPVTSERQGIVYGCATRQLEILDYIKKQRTAYDVDKVIKRLEKGRKESVLVTLKAAFELAIRIVKAGGGVDE